RLLTIMSALELILVKITYNIAQILSGPNFGLIFFLKFSCVVLRKISICVILPRIIGTKTTSKIVRIVAQILISTYCPTIANKYQGVNRDPRISPNTVNLTAAPTFPFCNTVHEIVIPLVGSSAERASPANING